MRTSRVLYFGLPALAVLSMMCVYLLASSSSTTVSAQSSIDLVRPHESARADQLAIALDFRSTHDLDAFGGEGVKDTGSSVMRGVRTDLVSENAQVDADRALKIINQLPCTNLSESDLAGHAVAAGVYCLPSMNLKGQLTLDAESDPAATFVFILKGSLEASPEASFSLVRGADPSNVYFAVNDSVAVAPNVNFAGTILARNSVTIKSQATVRGRVISVDGEVNLNGNNLGNGTGILEICKQQQGRGLEDRVFRFQIGAQIIEVPVGSCSGPIELATGNVVINELIDGRTVPTGTFSGRFKLVDVNSPTPGALQNFNLSTRTATVFVREGDVSNQTVVNFVNAFAISAVVEICKRAAVGDPDVTGFFDYTVDAIPNTVFSVPTGFCSPPITVLVRTTPSQSLGGEPNPGRGGLLITELARPEFQLESISTLPTDRLVNAVLNFGIRNTPACANIGNDPIPGACVFANPGGGFADTQVVEGGVENQTTVIFTNRSRPGQVKVCKIAGPGIPQGTRFRFEVRGTAPSNPFPGPILPGVPVVTAVDVPAGPASQGGFCQFVPGLFVVGTNVLIDELGPIDAIPGVFTVPTTMQPVEARVNEQPVSVVSSNIVPAIEDAAARQAKRASLQKAKPTDESEPVAQAATNGGGTSQIVANAIRNLAGCTANTLAANDDGSTGAVPLPFSANLGGNVYNSLFVNNNGNVTFNAPLVNFTPFALASVGQPILAPYWADVDTDPAASIDVTYGNVTVNGRQAFCTNWVNVGYFNNHVDKLNQFQLILIDRSDLGPGNVDVEFNYNTILWETGDASGGTNGFGGVSATAGVSSGAGNAVELTGARIPGSYLDSNPITGLTNNSFNSDTIGRYIFNFRAGVLDQPLRIASITSSTGFAPNGSSVQGIVVNPNPNLVTGQAIIPVRRAVSEITYTNFVFRPTLLKICKIAGPGVAVGTPFTFQISIDNEGGIFAPPSTIAVPDLVVQAGPASQGGFCAFARGPYTPTATIPPVGTFRVGSRVTVTEQAVANVSVGAVSSPTSTLASCSPANPRCSIITLGQPDAFNELTYVNVGPTQQAAGRALFDFDGDGKSDISIYRPSTGTWWYAASSDNGTHRAIRWGSADDQVAAGDFDGDGKTDPAVFRNGDWFILASSEGEKAFHFGLAGDIPQVGDYDGDGRADAAVFRPSNRTWYILQSRDGFTAAVFGLPTDKPTAADFDGDGRTDIAVYRDGVWYLMQSSAGFAVVNWGLADDIPIERDYDGDGKADPAVYRNGVWWILKSTGGFTQQGFGAAGNYPVPADYDGDGKADLAYIENGMWHIIYSGGGISTASGIPFGFTTDVPVDVP